MGTAAIQIFLSAVTNEFGSYREAVRRGLKRPNITVQVQENFIPTGTETLDKLDEYIVGCHAVVHLVGDMTGAWARSDSLHNLCERYNDFLKRLPQLGPLLNGPDAQVSYTQWEAYLAAYHGTRLVIAVPEPGARRDAAHHAEPAARAAQQAHLARLRELGHYSEVAFGNVDQLNAQLLRSSILELLIRAETDSREKPRRTPAGPVRRKPNGPLHGKRRPAAQPTAVAPLLPRRSPRHVFGREQVVPIIIDDITRTAHPVVIKGFGGVGKSTLAKLVADRCAEQRLFDVVVWIDVRDYFGSPKGENLLHKVLDQIAHAIEPDRPSVETALDIKIAAIIDLLAKGAHRYLLILDNYESILAMLRHEPSGGPATAAVGKIDVATVLARFIDRASESTPVLITTRTLPKFAAPVVRELHRLDAEPSAELIVERLRDQDLELPDAEIRQICALTYGIPKLIELAVGLYRSVPMAAIKARLEQVQLPLDQSDEVYGYLFIEAWLGLSDPERHVLLAMVLFSGFTLADALQQAAGLDERIFWKSVQNLEAISMLSVRERRSGSPDKLYSVHPLTQHLCEAEMRASASDFEQEASLRFVTFYLDCIQNGGESNFERLELDIDNLMAAIRIAHAKHLWRELVRFREPVNQFLWTFGYWRQRVEADTLMLDAARKLGDVRLAAGILVEDLGYTYLRFEELDRAETHVREGLKLFEQIHSTAGRALATRHLGKVALLRAEYELLQPGRTWNEEFAAAERLYEQSLKTREELRDCGQDESVFIADLKLDFGRLYWLWGRKGEQVERRCHDDAQQVENQPLQRALDRYAQAISVSDEAKSLFAQCGRKQQARRGIAKAWGNIGNAHKQKALFFRSEARHADAVAELDKAEQAYDESLKIAAEIRRHDEIAHAKWGLGEIYELYADLLPSRHTLLTQALIHAQESYQAYRRLATPHDIRITAELRDRIAAKLASLTAG